MRIGMISQWYAPETRSAAHPTAIARALAARGHELRVLTGYPSYPLGKVYDGYAMRLRTDEVIDGIQLRRVPDVPSHDRSAVRRAMSLTSFAASATAQVGWLRGADVCLVYLTPATVGVAGMTLRRLWGVPYALYVQDLWPEVVAASGFVSRSRATDAIEATLRPYLTRLYRGAGGIAGISPTMAELLAERGSRVPPVSIPNWIDEDLFRPVPLPGERRLDDRIWIMYAGGVGDVQALDAAVSAMTLLGDRPDIGLAIVGDGVALEAIRRQVQEAGLEDRVRFLGGDNPAAAMPGLIAESSAQLVSLKDLPHFRATIPHKLQVAMACARPVVCAVAGDAADVVRRAGAGVVATPEDPKSMAGAFQEIADMGSAERAAMGERARTAYLAELGAASGVAALEELLQNAIRQGR
jgi:colanic acid biosynthesis glycosyl transferase WcaI